MADRMVASPVSSAQPMASTASSALGPCTTRQPTTNASARDRQIIGIASPDTSPNSAGRTITAASSGGAAPGASPAIITAPSAAPQPAEAPAPSSAAAANRRLTDNLAQPMRGSNSIAARSQVSAATPASKIATLSASAALGGV